MAHQNKAHWERVYDTKQPDEVSWTLPERRYGGYQVIGTFSDKGPEKCSGLDIKQYSEGEMERLLTAEGLEKIKCITEDHTTPFGTTQNFLFCSFRKN